VPCISETLVVGQQAIHRETYLQPVHRALDISGAQHQAVTLQKTGEGHSDLLSALITLVHVLQRLVPEGQQLGRDGAAEADRGNQASPDILDDEVWGGLRASPRVVKGAELGLGVPASLLSGLDRLGVERSAEG
jgi:hypothetical protein